jgi:superfamily II DNA or RNA helicase
MQITPYLHQNKIGESLQCNGKGIVVAGTGAGKSYTIGWDIQKRIDAGESVIVVVAPRIMLCQQLFKTTESLLRSSTFQHMFVYSGEAIQREEEHLTSEQILDVSFATTSITNIQEEKERADRNNLPLLIFTTYHSLNRVVDSGIPIDTAYLDEVHNAVALEFSKYVKKLSQIANRLYSFTATLKKTNTKKGRGNNNEEIYGKIICEINAKELVESGVIVPPKINYLYSHINASEVDEVSLNRDVIKQVVEHYEENYSHLNHKILVACAGTEIINKLQTTTDLFKWASLKGYDVFHTTSTYGDWVNGVRVKSRGEFLNMLQECGSDSNRKMLVLHYSILSEGIDVPGLTGCVLGRNMNPITLTQTIGRVVRMLPVDRHSILEGIVKPGDVNSYVKGYGLVTVPIHEDSESDLEETVSLIYNALCGMGYPPEVILQEEDTKGKKVMSLPDDFKDIVRKKTKEVDAEWEWVYKKNLFFGEDSDEPWTNFL